MNLHRPYFVAACTAVLALPLTALAEPNEKPDREARRAAMLKKFDANGNGKLDPEEQEKMRAEMTKGGGRDPARMKKMLERFDKDGDGKLSEEERAAARAEMQKRRGAGGLKGKGGEKRAEMLKKFDKDGDGKLSDDERAAMREAMKGQRGKNAKPKKAE